MHRMIEKARTALPLRLLLIILLLVGLAYATGRHCADDGVVADSTATVAGHDHLAVTLGQDLHDDPLTPGTPGELLGLCITMLAALAVAMVLLTGPGRRWAGVSLPRVLPAAVASFGRPPVLSQLGVSRT
ncbi:hypothetical protein HDA40_007769 [Hamadaea flava]|uniref:Uncharacterized protein n=1 Tax=Hamadaea flava TaxID=1742688 RepID=A0ABV8LXT4_9ACTN|nr:hypothetical protein [Hamadaea flava]MCP2329262.1 hypothetical protein [Hamadaea flava]